MFGIQKRLRALGEPTSDGEEDEDEADEAEEGDSDGAGDA